MSLDLFDLRQNTKYCWNIWFTRFSGHRPIGRECAWTGLRSHVRCHPRPITQPVKVGHTTGVYDPYSFRRVMWDLLRPTRPNQWKCCETGRTVFRPYPRRLESKHLQMSLQRQHFGLQFGRKIRRPPECWSGRGLNPRPPVRQTGALPTELTRPCLGFVHTIPDSFCFRKGLLCAHKNCDSGVLSVTERSYAVPTSKLESHMSHIG